MASICLGLNVLIDCKCFANDGALQHTGCIQHGWLAEQKGICEAETAEYDGPIISWYEWPFDNVLMISIELSANARESTQ